MHREFTRCFANKEDWLTFRRWMRGIAIFYGLIGLLVVSFVAVRNPQTHISHNAVATTPANVTMTNNRYISRP